MAKHWLHRQRQRRAPMLSSGKLTVCRPMARASSSLKQEKGPDEYQQQSSERTGRLPLSLPGRLGWSNDRGCADEQRVLTACVTSELIITAPRQCRFFR